MSTRHGAHRRGALRINYLTDDAIQQGPSSGLLNGPNEAGALVAIADAVFDLVAEELWAVPFVCPYHSTGLHPQIEGHRAIWFCDRGQHSQGDIGQLRHKRRRG